MIWVPPPSGKRGRQQRFSEPATNLPDNESPVGMVVIGCAIGPSDNDDAPDDGFRSEPPAVGWNGLGGTGLQHPMPPPQTAELEPAILRRNQPTEPSHPLTGIAAQYPAAQWTAPASRLRVKANGTRASMAARNAKFGVRYLAIARRAHPQDAAERAIDAETLEVRAVEVTNGEGFRSTSRRNPDPDRRLEPLNRPWQTCHRGRRISLSGKGQHVLKTLCATKPLLPKTAVPTKLTWKPKDTTERY